MYSLTFESRSGRAAAFREVLYSATWYLRSSRSFGEPMASSAEPRRAPFLGGDRSKCDLPRDGVTKIHHAVGWYCTSVYSPLVVRVARVRRDGCDRPYGRTTAGGRRSDSRQPWPSACRGTEARGAPKTIYSMNKIWGAFRKKNCMAEFWFISGLWVCTYYNRDKNRDII